VSEYAHPMGWRKAVLAGFAYGGVIGGLPWILWRGIALAAAPLIVDYFCAMGFAIGLSAVLSIENFELTKIKKGTAIDIRITSARTTASQSSPSSSARRRCWRFGDPVSGVLVRTILAPPSERKLKWLTIFGCIPVVGLLAIPVFFREDGFPVTDVDDQRVAVLFADPKGVYANLPGVDLWDEARDARLYAGPWPVVAHPPCNRWGSLAFLNRALHGYEIGADGGCFEAALVAVREYGGVLEHPAGSLAWSRFCLPHPRPFGWSRSLLDDGWVTEVEQASYGHRARKRTWLYYVGPEPPPLDWHSVPVTAKVSGFNHHPAGGYVADEASRVRPREASATPPAFRDVLLAMARSAARVSA
jgi:hypothetical protein